ncbi:hypothetical protein ED236_00450 [Pseudomethylobacillus aquaticus]|uniref:Portal protein n=1 Tax=Pseudomethylobacillus aquaticus TaxID=2676064 RepID=A0A3N0V6K2_9PROT|nr:hypothetical protein [Pseudomethylobacillus aquaticus]ROH87998.1 hypothetical protein ED236_00450 [Pseudomethylobacillus aquaticus]
MQDQSNATLDEEEAIRLAKAAFSTSDSWFNVSVRNTMERDIRQVQSQHPSGSKYDSDHYKGRSKLFRPKTRATLRQAEAVCAQAFFSTADVVHVVAEDDTSKIDQASAEVMKQLMNYRLQKSIPWFRILVGAFQEAYTVGVVASLQTWEYDETNSIDRPKVQLLPPENVRIDPAADWTDPVNSSPYVILLLPMYAYQIKEMADKPKNPWKKIDDSKMLSGSTRVSDSIRLQREHGRTDSKEQTNEIGAYTIVWVHMNFVRHKGRDYVFYTLGDQELLNTPSLVEHEFPHLAGTGQRPIVFGVGTIEAHKVYPTSHPSMSRQVQAEINEVANLRIDNVRFALNKRYWVKRNRNVDIRSLVRNAPSSVTLMDDITTDARVVETNDVTGSAYQEQDRLNMDFDDIAGGFSGSSVATNRKLNETVGGMQMLSSSASQIGEYDLKVFTETWVEPVLRQVMLMEQAYETDETVLMLAGERGKLFRRFGLNEITDEMLRKECTLNVNVGTGSTNTFNQLEKLVYAFSQVNQLLGEQGMSRLRSDEIVKEILGKVGYKDGGRFYVEEGEDPKYDELIATIQTLQQQLNEKKPPELLAAEIEALKAKTMLTKADAVNTGVQSVFSAVQAGAAITQNPLIAPVSDQVMVAAGYQTPNPAGVDPNIQAPTTLADGVINGETLPEVRQNTSPTFPPVPSDPVSPLQGIETGDVNDAPG